MLDTRLGVARFEDETHVGFGDDVLVYVYVPPNQFQPGNDRIRGLQDARDTPRNRTLYG